MPNVTSNQAKIDSLELKYHGNFRIFEFGRIFEVFRGPAGILLWIKFLTLVEKSI